MVGLHALILFASVLLSGCAQQRDVQSRVHGSAGHEATSSHSFADAVRWSQVFDDPGRDEWQKPEEIIAALAIQPGMAVADLGAGTGYLLPYLSRAVGARGTVFALDNEPNLITFIRARIEREGIANVVPVLAAANDARLAARSVDRIVILDTYHHIGDRLNYLERLRPALKADARIVIVDWHKRELPEGPPVDHKLAREQVVDEMQTAGYALVAESDRLPYQYVLIFASDPR